MSPRTDGETLDRPSVAVIGAGFSGLLTALHLLADPSAPQVRLFERRGVFGRGAAYATNNPDHLLNVRVGNMSAFPDTPDHLARWLACHHPAVAKDGFVTRSLYGEYLQGLLRRAVDGQYGVNRLLLEADAVVAIRRIGEHWSVETALGRRLIVDAVVLATGSLPTSDPPGADAALLRSTRYVANPWAERAADDTPQGRVLLIGSGLTMVDVAISLGQPGRQLIAISRRGLLPRVHGGSAPASGRADFEGSPLEILRQLRAASAGRDWHAVIDAVRGSVRDLWMSWPQEQRRRFLRHGRAWWDVHRHRMAPRVAAGITTMIAAGELSIDAGALERLQLTAAGVEVRWRRRGATRSETFEVDGVINCTGPESDVRRARDPLIRDLLKQDLIRPDVCALGLDVDAHARPLDTWGAASPGFYVVGPLTRGAFWEITSVPDIRSQALAVAQHLGATLGARAAA